MLILQLAHIRDDGYFRDVGGMMGVGIISNPTLHTLLIVKIPLSFLVGDQVHSVVGASQVCVPPITRMLGGLDHE
jgi:hypothetical protein